MKRVISSLVVGMSAAAILCGCSILPLPDEERYRYINEVKEELDYESAGAVISESSDPGDVLSVAFFQAEIEGSDAYSFLRDKLVSIENIDCDVADDFQSHCSVNGVAIRIKHDQLDNVSLRISDSRGGKR